MELKYDIPQYIVKTKMSDKIRILVEGKDDKNHIKNMFDAFKVNPKYKIDLATEIKGTCKETSLNHRAKIEKSMNIAKQAIHIRNYFSSATESFEILKLQPH